MTSSRNHRNEAPWPQGATGTRTVRRGSVDAGSDEAPEASAPAQGLSTAALVDDAPGATGETTQEVAFTIIDDPANESVYKGAGSYAATRGETAVRAVEAAFAPLRFDLRFERDLTALHASGKIHASISNDAFLVVLKSALTSTGTRLAPEKHMAGANRPYDERAR